MRYTDGSAFLRFDSGGTLLFFLNNGGSIQTCPLTTTFSSGETYYLRLYQSTTQLSFYRKQSGNDWGSIIYAANGPILMTNAFIIGSNILTSFDMKDFYMKINNEIVYSGMKDGEGTQNDYDYWR
jgi:hypothetical protein